MLIFQVIVPLKDIERLGLYSWFIGTLALLLTKPTLESLAIFLRKIMELQGEAQKANFWPPHPYFKPIATGEVMCN